MNKPANPIDSTRRQWLRHSAAGTVLVLAAPLVRAALGQTSTVEVTEGPYFVDELLNRSDIRVDPSDGSVQAGILMLLSVGVSTLDTATGVLKPLPGVVVDIWHANVAGLYSDEAANNTVGKKFLRGYQMSDRQGKVQFRSVYPGWYSGRSPHIHCKVRQYSGTTKLMDFTTQFFMDENLSQLIYTDSMLPYAARGLPDQPHATDQVYNGSNSCVGGAKAGDSLGLTLARVGNYVTAKFNIIIDTTARCSSAETGGGGGGGGGGGMPPGGPPPGTPPGTPPTP